MTDAQKLDALTTLVTTPTATFMCPTRRDPILYPNTDGMVSYNCNNVPLVGKLDYAANCGDSINNQADGGPPSLAQATMYTWADMSTMTGVCYQRSEVKTVQITDGTSKTYLFGEKYISPDNYSNGLDDGDNENTYTGYDNDMCRSTNLNYPPLSDTPGFYDTFRFGSAHGGAFNMVFVDGSVHSLPYEIDPELHRRLGNRQDGLSVDLGDN